MTTAALTANLLAKKGQAIPSDKVQHLHGPTDTQTTSLTSEWQVMLEKRQQKKNQHPLPGAKRVHKSFYLNAKHHNQLRLLAARTGQSQQTIMEDAMLLFLERVLKNSSCICKSL